MEHSSLTWDKWSCVLIRGKTTHTWSFGAGAMHETKHVPTSFGHGSHLGEHWEVVDDEWHFASLLSRQCLSVSKDAKPGDVGGCMGIEGVHEASR